MINIPTTAPVKKNKTRKTQARLSQSPDARRLMHEVYNHLTVMNLCCFKIRAAAARLLDEGLLSDVGCMEQSITDLGALLESLPRSKPEPPAAAPPHRDSGTLSPAPANVYALFNSSRRRC